MESSSLSRYLEDLLGNVIKVNRGGPNSRIGKLLAVHVDYITLLTKEDGVLYVYADHIKSITENVKDSMKIDKDDRNEEEEANMIDCHCNTPRDFESLLCTLKYKWVQINRGGPDKVDGVVNDISDEIITLVHDKEVIRVFAFHINNISVGNNSEKDSQGKKEEKRKR